MKVTTDRTFTARIEINEREALALSTLLSCIPFTGEVGTALAELGSAMEDEGLPFKILSRDVISEICTGVDSFADMTFEDLEALDNG